MKKSKKKDIRLFQENITPTKYPLNIKKIDNGCFMKILYL
jgi:hypothetical protein